MVKRILDLNATPGESEFSWGKGMMGDPEKGYVPEQVDQLRAELRTDTTDPSSQVDYYVAGNPDRFGPAKKLVRDTAPHTESKFDPMAPGGVKGDVFEPKVKRAE